MKRIALALIYLVLFAGAACAQTVTAAAPLPKGCANGVITDASGNPSCAPAPTAGGVAWGPPADYISGRTLALTDANHTLIFDSATPGTMPFPLPSSLGTGFITCVIVYNQPLTFTKATGNTAAFKGGSAILNHDENACAQPDLHGNWSVGSSSSAVIANPNLAP